MSYVSLHPQSAGQQALLPITGLPSQPHLSTVESPSSEPTTCLSPFAFEKDINIWFRMALAGRHAVDAKLVSEGTAAVDDSTPSTPSSDGTNTWSDTSSSHSYITSSSLAYMTASSANHISPSTLAGHRCSGCDKFFRLRGDLRKHWFRTHEKRYFCTVPTCQAAFHLNADLARHNKSKHGVQGRKSRIHCEYAGCSETFTRRDNMIRHKREEHEHCGRKSRES